MKTNAPTLSRSERTHLVIVRRTPAPDRVDVRTLNSKRTVMNRITTLVAVSSMLIASSTSQGQLAHLTHRYSFTTDASDSAGTAHGTLVNGAVISGGAVVCNGTGAYVNLPAAVIGLNAYPALTLELWSTQPAINQDYSMTAAFGGTWPNGNGRDYLMISTTRGDNVSRGAIALTPDQDSPWADEIGVNGPELNDAAEHHYVLTVTGSELSFYIDGVPRGSAAVGAVSLSGLSTQFAYLGKGVYSADATVQCAINEFRIYKTALTAEQVQSSFAFGPNVVAGGGPAKVQVQPKDQTVLEGRTVTFTALGEGTPPLHYQWQFGGADLPGATNATLELVNVATDQAGNYQVLITNMYGAATSRVALLTVLVPEGCLTHRYSFAADANDTVGTADGIARGGAYCANGAVVLDGTSGYVDLPNNLMTSYDSATIEAWVTDNGSGGWARIYDFGNSTGGEGVQGIGTQYMFLSLPSGMGNLRGAYSITGGGAGEQIVEWPEGRPAIGEKAHIVWTSDAMTKVARLYVNGVQVGVNSNMTLTPMSIGPTLNNWLGRSQFSADPLFKGSIDEFRIYSLALAFADVLRNYANGPDSLQRTGAVVLLSQPSNQTVTLGRTVTISSVADGTPPLHYQWQFEGANLVGATKSSLVLSTVGANNVGGCQLVITNQFGAVTSTVAQLTVIPSTNAVFWDGGGDGVSWTYAANWSDDTLPSATNIVIIGGLETNVTIDINSDVTIQSMQCSASLKISRGSLTLTKASSQVAGDLTLASGRTLAVIGSTASLSASGSAILDGASVAVSGGAVVSLPGVRSYVHTNCWNTDLTASGAGSVLLLPGLTNLTGVTTCGHQRVGVSALGGGRVVMSNLVNVTRGWVAVVADGAGSVVDLTGLASFGGDNEWQLSSLEARNGGMITIPRCGVFDRVSISANAAGFVNMGLVRGISGGTCKLLADGGGSVIDLSSLSSFATPLGASELKAINGGTILLPNSVFLLVNVAVQIAGHPVLPPVVSAGASVSLYGRAWHGYWVEWRDTRVADSPWQFYSRVAQTNALQVVGGPPQSWQAFRVWEFMADPPILDLRRAGAGQAYPILFGATNKAYGVETAASLDSESITWSPWGESTGTMTNTFRILPAFPATEPKQFFRAKQE